MTMRLDEWCESCKEYDQERHCCPRFNHVIRTTLDDVKREAYKHGKSKGIKKGLAMAQRIKGRWIQDSYYDEKYVCDKCGEPCATYINGKPRDRFCKWCGADMRGEDDADD